jgi:hypothetical protein
LDGNGNGDVDGNGGGWWSSWSMNLLPHFGQESGFILGSVERKASFAPHEGQRMAGVWSAASVIGQLQLSVNERGRTPL